MHGEDTEITLGIGKILTMFVGLVILCAIFFGAGYTVGKSAVSQTAPNSNQQTIPPADTSSAQKPGSAIAGAPAKTQDCPNGDCNQTGSELTFYKNVEQKDPNPQLVPPEEEQPAKVVVQQPAKTKPEKQEVTKRPAPEPTRPAPAPQGNTFIVQVAAVSKQQDAQALVAALRRKQYSVSVVTVATDRLYHVQAGPFSNQKQAESLRTRLMNDGYTPIVKR